MAKLKTEVELHPDAWARFERAVDIVAKSPPQHRTKKYRKAGAPKRKAKQTKEGR
jgi:hypothetical protein